MAISKHKKNYHTSIDTLLVIDYNKIIETNDLSHLIIDGEAEEKDLLEAWNGIIEQVIEEKLKDERYVKTLQDRIRKAQFKANAYLKWRKADIARIKMDEESEKDEKQASFYETLLALENIRGREIDETRLTLRKWLNLCSIKWHKDK